MARRRLSRRQAAADCRSGMHRFMPGTEAGGGIVRRTCRHCGTLSIDLTGVATSRLLEFTIDRRVELPPSR